MASKVYVVRKPGNKGRETSTEVTLAELTDDQLQQLSVYGDTDPVVLTERIRRRSKGGSDAE